MNPRELLRKSGFDIVRYPIVHSGRGRLARLLTFYNINLVLDVGANRGQFAHQLRGAGYTGKIMSFEPLEQAHQALLKVSENDPNWTVAERMAIGEANHRVILNVAENEESSSLRAISGLHQRAEPKSQYVAQQTVNLRTLDSCALSLISEDVSALLKIDAQGYEGEVLLGAEHILTKIRGVQLELSLVQLYEGQRDYLSLLTHLRSRGFEVMSIEPGFTDPASGRLLQFDCLMFR
jgi:FkbM family methyltransferase